MISCDIECRRGDVADSCSQVLGLLAYAALTTIVLSTILLLTPGECFVMQIEREVPSSFDDIIRQHSTLKR